jgi:hypothetical protein
MGIHARLQGAYLGQSRYACLLIPVVSLCVQEIIREFA